jgi:hypothetical protein
MNSPLMIDDKLVEEARRLGNHASPEEAVRQALEEYVRRHKRLRIVELFGTVEHDDDYDYKAARSRKLP